MKVLVTPTSFKPDHPTPALKRLQEFAREIVYNPYGRPLAEEEVSSLIRGCDGYIAGVDQVGRTAIEAADKLKVISRYGAGVDRVDIAAAAQRGIPVCNTPGANAQAVADLTLGLILCLARRLPLLDRMTRSGAWTRSTGMELYKKTIGILGLGAVGKAVAKRAQGFDMRVLAYDPFLNEAYAKGHGILPARFERVLAEADIVTLHLPLTDETRHVISRHAMERMKQGALLVNTARGGLIDEEAAYEMLKCGRLGGLGLDAYETEPPGDSPLFGLEQVVCTPHTGSHTGEAVASMAAMSVENLICVLEGRSCPYVVNGV